MRVLIFDGNSMSERPSWFQGLFGGGKDRESPEQASSDVREKDDFNDFWGAHGSRFAELVTSEEDRLQLQMVYKAYRNNPSVIFEETKTAEMLEVLKAVLGGPDAPPPAAPAAALERPTEENEKRPPTEMAA